MSKLYYDESSNEYVVLLDEDEFYDLLVDQFERDRSYRSQLSTAIEKREYGYVQHLVSNIAGALFGPAVGGMVNIVTRRIIDWWRNLW